MRGEGRHSLAQCKKGKKFGIYLAKWGGGESNKESWEGERKKMSKKISVRVGAAWIKGQK